MENFNLKLAEMANTANYAAMSYYELVTIDLAFHLAIGEIKPLIEKKREEELAAHTQEYAAKMKSYCATKAEVLECLEKETFSEVSFFSTPTQDVDDQTIDDTSDNGMEENHQEDEPILALPEHIEENEKVAEESNDVDVMPSEEESELESNVVPETNEQSFIEEAMSVMRTLTIPKDVNPNGPYYMECDFGYEGELGHSHPYGRNMRRADLEEFRSASEVYYRIFKKKNVIASTNDCLAYNDGLNTFMLRLYHFPEGVGSAIDTPAQETNLSSDGIKELKKKQSYLRKAIKLAKENAYSDGTDVDRPFYDKYIFRPGMKRSIELKRERERHYEDAAALTELMPAYESYAKLFREGYTVLAKDNCVAAMMYETIYVVLFNIPTQEKKMGRVSKKSVPAAKEIESAAVTSTSSTQTVDDLILKAVDLTRNLPLANGTDANSTYYLQSSFSVTNEGALIYSGKPFSSNVSLNGLDRCRLQHEKYARTMKASKIVSTDEYTAFVSNDGKAITVFDYNAKSINVAS